MEGGENEQAPVDVGDKPKKKTSTAPVVASQTESFLKTVLAPELLSANGKIAILFMYAILVITAVYGAMKVTVDFRVDYFINEGSLIYNYFQLNNEYF